MEKCQNCTSFGANVSKQHRGLSKGMGNGDGEMQVVYNQGQDLLIALLNLSVSDFLFCSLARKSSRTRVRQEGDVEFG